MATGGVEEMVVACAGCCCCSWRPPPRAAAGGGHISQAANPHAGHHSVTLLLPVRSLSPFIISLEFLFPFIMLNVYESILFSLFSAYRALLYLTR
jgi:hypothetical protein